MVSEIAGTTRDVIEEQLVIDGVLFRILDTAGLRMTDDRLEQMGIERTLRTIERAQIVIRMEEVSTTEKPTEEPFTLREDQILIRVVNKIDTTPERALPSDGIAISARTGEGIDRLRHALREAVPTSDEEQTLVTSERHYEALTTAAEALNEALHGLETGLPPGHRRHRHPHRPRHDPPHRSPRTPFRPLLHR